MRNCSPDRRDELVSVSSGCCRPRCNPWPGLGRPASERARYLLLDFSTHAGLSGTPLHRRTSAHVSPRPFAAGRLCDWSPSRPPPEPAPPPTSSSSPSSSSLWPAECARLQVWIVFSCAGANSNCWPSLGTSRRSPFYAASLLISGGFQLSFAIANCSPTSDQARSRVLVKRPAQRPKIRGSAGRPRRRQQASASLSQQLETESSSSVRQKFITYIFAIPVLANI
jgi:hypothetical protein